MKGYCDGNGASSCINRQMPHVQHEVPSQLKPSVLAQATQIMNTVFMLPWGGVMETQAQNCGQNGHLATNCGIV